MSFGWREPASCHASRSKSGERRRAHRERVVKITFVLPFAGLSGGIKVVAIYARALSKSGHDVTVVSLPWRQPTRLDRLKAFARGRSLPSPPFQSPYLDDLGTRHVVLDSHRPVTDRDLPDADVVVATWWETAEWVAGLSPRKGRKFYLLQDYEVFPYLPVDRVIATYALPLTRIAVSRYIRDMLRQNHGIDDVTVVNNGIDLEHFSVPARVKPDAFRVGFLYQTSPRKNTGLALDIVNRARLDLPGLHVIAFGSCGAVADYPVPDWVDYHVNPKQDLIPELYGSCTAWLFTSTSEGFGLPILEAMACGTPVIATRAGAAPDLIDGRNGVLVEPSVDAFMTELERFRAMSTEDWLASSRQARATAEANTWEASVEQFERILHL